MGSCDFCAKKDHEHCALPLSAQCGCSCRKESHDAAIALAEKQCKKYASDEYQVIFGTKDIDGIKMYPDRVEQGWYVRVPDKRDPAGWPLHNTFIPFSQYWVYYG